jgi:aminoglycoside phosphotransferase (APT) family kinase protein
LKTQPYHIDPQQLTQAVNAAYGLGLTSLTFLPKGEDAYAYLGRTTHGARYFVRAQATLRAGALESAQRVTYALHTRYGLQTVVAPLPNQAGTFTLNYGSYTVSVFPFISGRTLYDQGATDADLVQAANIMAQLHQSRAVDEIPFLPYERFENPFEPPLLQALEAIDSPTTYPDSYQRRVIRLLAAEQTDLLTTLAQMKNLGAKAQALTSNWVLTHGDPNLDNLLKDDQGQLHLTDWGDLAIGPPERDLFTFTGERFEEFLRPYLHACEKVQLHLEMFNFYFYRWAVQEIADYTTRILFQDLEPVENEHAWLELQPYLPIRHRDIAASVEAVQVVLKEIQTRDERNTRLP